MKKFYLGIDVSKEKLDFCLLTASKVMNESIVKNDTKSIKKSLLHLFKEYVIEKDNLLICAEYTGQYTYPLCCVCRELGIDLWLENPAQIKYRSGIQREKNDKLDAKKIASYACRFAEDVRLFELSEKTIETLKQLVSER